MEKQKLLVIFLAKIISICSVHFLAEYFAEALQVFAAFILFYSTCAYGFCL